MRQEHIELTEALIRSVIQSYFNPKKGDIVDLNHYSFELQEILNDIFKAKIHVSVLDDTLRVNLNEPSFDELIINFNVELDE